ncbi:MAG: YdcF family protein [Rhodocyclaceae bacterium]|nr:YdcF family protein [Rhodocyclaceae bacterium]
MPFPFLLKKILSVLLLPPVMPLLCIVAGLLLMRRRPRLGRGLAWGGLALILLFGTPATVDLLVSPLEDVPVLQEKDIEGAQAIVILGAGYRRYMPEYGGPTPNRLALERLRYGARLARHSGLPVMVSGEAELMAESLRQDSGIAPRWLEGTSLDTAGNARHSAELLLPEGFRRIVLVTHAAHMRRAAAEFAAQGFEVIPAPTGFLVDRGDDEGFFYYVPGATAAHSGWYAAHEWAGLLVQKLRMAMR